MGTLLITKAFLLTAVSKKAAHFTLFVKCFLENSYKNLGPAFLRDPAFLNLVTLGLPVTPFLSGIDANSALGIGGIRLVGAKQSIKRVAPLL